MALDACGTPVLRFRGIKPGVSRMNMLFTSSFIHTKSFVDRGRTYLEGYRPAVELLE
jgi:hypothetical protein